MTARALPVLPAAAARAQPELRAACAWLGARSAEGAAEWRRVADEGAWRGGEVPGLHQRVALVAALAAGEGAHAALEEAARVGARARARGLPSDALVTEGHLLAGALHRQLGSLPAPPSRAVALAVDGAVSLAVAAALLGHARPELEADGRWPAALDELREEAG